MRDLTLLTGATGLVGAAVLRRLLQERARVRVLVRHPERLPRTLRGRVDVICGELDDQSALARAVEGARTVLHLAACARAWSRDPTEFHRINVSAVQQLLSLAEDAGVKRLVHVSTVLTLPALRARARQAGRKLTPYEETKLMGERLVEAWGGPRRAAVIVHPARIFGPGPLNDANGVTRIISRCLRRLPVPRLLDGDVLANYVHVDDVAHGILLARFGRPGGHYVLGGENASFRRLLSLIAETARVVPRTIPLPRPVALAAAGISHVWGKVGGTVLITPDWARSYFEDQRVDCEPARRELGYAPRPLRTGLEETIQWLRSSPAAA